MNGTEEVRNTPADGSSGLDASADTSTSDAGPLDPKPPAGFVRCGHGTLDATEGAAACAKSGDPFLTKNVPDRKCDAVTFTSAKWEVWCGNGPLYVWAKFEGMKSTGKYLGCQGYPAMRVDSAWLVLGSSASGMLPSPSIGTFDTTTTMTIALGSLGNTKQYQSGTGAAWVIADLPAQCNAQAVKAAVSGFEVSWDAANPG